MSTAPYEGRILEFTQGDRLRKARQATGLTVREFADKLGVSHGTVTNAEMDHRNVRRITLNAWALISGVSREWLETGQAPGHDGGPGGTVRQQGLEPRTRWYEAKRADLQLSGTGTDLAA